MALAGIALGTVKRMIRRGYTLDQFGAETFRRVRDLGYLIGRNQFYMLRREVIASTPLRWVGFVDKFKEQLQQHRFIKTEDRFPTTYKYVVQINAINPLTGEPYQFTTAIHDQQRLRPLDIERQILDRFDDYPPRGNDRQSEERALQYKGTFDTINTIQLFRR